MRIASPYYLGFLAGSVLINLAYSIAATQQYDPNKYGKSKGAAVFARVIVLTGCNLALERKTRQLHGTTNYYHASILVGMNIYVYIKMYFQFQDAKSKH